MSVRARVGILCGVQPGELDTLLQTLSQYGVTSAEFSPDGRLTKVEMIPLGVVGAATQGATEDGGSEPVETPVDEAALRMLGRRGRAA